MKTYEPVKTMFYSKNFEIREQLIMILKGAKFWNGDVGVSIKRNYRGYIENPNRFISKYGHRHISLERRKEIAEEMDELPF